MSPEQGTVMASLVSGSSRLSAVLVLPLVALTVTAALGSSSAEVVPRGAGQQEVLSLAWIKDHFPYNTRCCVACNKGGKTPFCVLLK